MSSEIIDGEGIVLDIDETLSDTITYLVSGLQERFGNPENLSVQGIIDKYRYTWDVPYWQSDEASNWVISTFSSNKVVEDLVPIEGALTFVNKIKEIIPIVGYVTARPECVLEGTKKWLVKHGFPDAPVICRPASVPGIKLNEWKAEVLMGLSPNVKGIIDDNMGIIEFLEDYEGHVFLYSRDSVEDGVRGIPCIDWQTVYEEVGKKFG